MAVPQKLQFLAETVLLESTHLQTTDSRLFASTMTAERAEGLRSDVDLSERTDAFVARFGRLQDTLTDKLLPEFLRVLADPVGSTIDNLDRAEKLGLLRSADQWLATRKLHDRMVHEYVRDATELAEALNQGHAQVPLLTGLAKAISEDCHRRGLIAG